jgi:hypothetical protein
MTNATITKTAEDAKELFDTIMNLYMEYLNALEALVPKIPDNETEMLKELYIHIGEVQDALDHDISVFQKAVNSDEEDIHKIKDNLKIGDIYKTLQIGTK